MEHSLVVLAGILPNRRDALMTALGKLDPEHFHNKVHRLLFQMMDQYFSQNGGMLPIKVLEDLLERKSVEPAQALLFTEVYSTAANTEVAEHEFRYAISALQDIREKERTGETIATAFEILERGATVDKRDLQGHRHAREYLYDHLAQIDRLAGAEESPEGDLRTETSDLLNEYVARKEGKYTPGIMTGIPTLDRVTGGLVPGDLCLLAAYTGQGKTQMMVQMAWEAAVMQGKNIFYATSETVRATIMRRIIARHSRLPQFGLPDGLDSAAIKNASLTPTEEDVYRDVLDDLKTNPAYGRMHVAQIPRGATLSYMEARMLRQQQSWEVEWLGLDYLNLLTPDYRRQSAREEANDIIKGAKIFATAFNGGKGIPFVSPWQMSQARYREAAETTGAYGLGSLADTSEAEKSADLIVSFLRLPDSPLKSKMQVLKNRDGAIPPAVDLDVDFRSSYMAESLASAYGSEVEDFGL